MEDFVRVGIADAAEEMRISQRPLECVVVSCEGRREFRERATEYFNTPGIDVFERVEALQQMKRRALARAGFGQEERSVWKINRREIVLPARFYFRDCRQPMQAAGDHQMEHQPELIVELKGNALSDAPQCSHLFSFQNRDWRLRRPQDKWVSNTNRQQRLANGPFFEGFDVQGDVGKFRHGSPENYKSCGNAFSGSTCKSRSA